MPAGWWWYIPLIPAPEKQRQIDLFEFKASLVYKVSSRNSSISTEKPCVKNPQKEANNNQTNKKPHLIVF